MTEQKTGIRGCSGKTKRRGKERFCAQRAIYDYKGRGYCYYHHPLLPRKFGERYGSEAGGMEERDA